MTCNGCPEGLHVARLSNRSNGCPFANTLVEAVIHCAVMQGGAVVPTNAHPETVHGGGWVTTGWPLTLTRGLGTVGVA